MRKRSFNADPPDVAGGPAGEAGLAPGQRSPPLIVGVGVSPGCDDALSALLAAMPPRPGMAFVVVWQQRDDGDGTARDALAQRSAMPVREVQQRTSIEPNIVYIPAPRHTVAIEAGEVYPLRPKRARNSACGEIDRLFTELASGRAERAVGVVLSGGKPCGEAGLREIKERGGLTVVDEPGGSALRRLPRSPFDTAHIDMILPVARIPEKLVSYARHACFGFLEGSRDSSSPSTTLIEEDLLPITELLRAETNHDFRRYRKNTLWRRVQRRMGLNQVDRISDYVELLRENPLEVQALRRDLLICVTRFFRDEEAWAVLDRKVLRELVVGADASMPIRAWIPGCATGEEAYTLAMLLKERLDAAGVARRMQIFATDVAEDALDAARAGIYPSSIENDVIPERLARFFVKEGEHYKVSKALRECVVFAEQNVLAQPPFSRLDLICCRNLLIYLEPEAQQRVISVFQYALKKGGCLFLGNSETVGASNAAFAPISKKWRIFRRTDQAVPPPVDTFTEASVRFSTPSLRVTQSAGHGRITARGRGIAERAQRQLLRELERGVAVVDAHDRLLYVHGSADLYLQLSLGEVDADYPDLVELAREGLRPKLRSALKEARRTGQRVATESRVQREGRTARCKIVVRPLEGSPPDEGTLLVTFEPLSVSAVDPEDAVVETESELVRELQAELAATREQLNSTIEDLEAANDALKAAHEEAISINEELQSGNEELETSKEELQSLNEELTTLNHQLEAKVAELQSTTNDLDNLLTSSNVPTIFLDAEWRIRRYTPSCLELFNLIPSDVGRPLTDISSRIDDPELLDEAREVLLDLRPRERQVQSRRGDRYYQRRVLPYRTSDKRVEGVVITYSDVTQLQHVALKLSRRERQQKALASLGQQALIEKDIHALFDIAVRIVQEAFDAEFVKLLELLPDGKTLLLRAGAGWREGLVGRYVIDKDGDSQAAVTLSSERPIVVTKLDEDDRFRSPDLLVSHGIVSGISTVIRGEKGPIGVLGVHTTHEARFSDDDIHFMESVAHILSDAYHLRRGEQALQEAEERLRLATAAHDLGTWDYDVRSDRIVASSRAKELFGIPPDEEITYADLVARVHPEDRPRVEEAARRCLLAADGGHCDIEYRTLPADDGSVRWIRDIRQAYFSDGRAARVIGTFEDVTERKEAEQANFERLELAERLRRIAEATPGTVFTFKVRPGEGRPSFPYMAPNACELYGLEPGLLTDDASLLFARIPDEDNERLREVTIRSAETMSMWHAQFRYDHPKKGAIWVEAYASPVAQPDGTILWHGIAHDITNQKQTELELREARRIAEAADKAKSEFLANMSHEIRTPMSAILGYAEILGNQLQDPDNLQSLETIRTNGLYLLEIIDGILDLSRIEAGKLELDRRRVRPDTIVREVQSLLKLHANEKGLALEVEFDGPLPETIETDPTRLKQILINLVENAIKFTDSGRVRIVVGLLPGESKLRIDVVDTGPGIPDEIVERLFQPFTQADSSVTRRFGGSGLGLSICRALSRMLGGDVTVKTRPGAGSTFTVTIATGALEGVEMFEPDAKPAGLRFEAGDIRSLSCRVLVVDDRRDMRYLAQHMLEEAGARVSHAADGREALEQVAAAEAQGDPFDVVLLDMQMPMLDGYAAARALRERGYERPIVALTANAMKSDERRCLESGCDDYLSKPLSRATLVNTVAYYASDVTLAELAERRRAYGFRVPETEGRADEGSIADGDSRRGASSSERAAAGEDRNLPARVLVVDDNRDSCTLLRLLLQNSGCEVATAGSGGEALSAVDTFKPTVAVIDIGLPDIGGDELVGALKARVDLGACRFICLSGRRESDIDWRAAGFDHFVQKPASFDSLKRLILGD